MMCQVLEQEQARAPHPALRRHLQHRGLVRPLPGDDHDDYNDANARVDDNAHDDDDDDVDDVDDHDDSDYNDDDDYYNDDNFNVDILTR